MRRTARRLLPPGALRSICLRAGIRQQCDDVDLWEAVAKRLDDRVLRHAMHADQHGYPRCIWLLPLRLTFPELRGSQSGPANPRNQVNWLLTRKAALLQPEFRSSLGGLGRQ